ncbi:MAG: sulfite exporter TauE/SafE family protein [Conexivisphaerales archaeon]|jgi:hypothetical protein
MGLDTLAAALLLGLSSGVQCTVTCLPLLLTQLTAAKRTVRDNLRISLLFSLGRLMVYFAMAYLLYISFRAFSGTLGNPLSESLTSVLMGTILIYYCVKAIRKKAATNCGVRTQGKLAHLPFTNFAFRANPGRNSTSLLLGIVSSMSVCLPLVALISLSANADLATAFSSVSLFWIGSSVYSVGLALTLAGVSRIRIGASLSRRVGFIGSLSGVMLGAIMLLAGLSALTIL